MKHLPWLLLAAVLVYPLFAQGTLTSVSFLGQPLKILGQPAASEWIDIESNEVGQPATTYTVPDGHRLTLKVMVVTLPFVNGPNDDWIGFRILVNGVEVGADALRAHDFDYHAVFQHHLGEWSSFQPGTVLHSGQTLTVERTDVGQSSDDNYAEDAQTFTVRGFLEKVK